MVKKIKEKEEKVIDPLARPTAMDRTIMAWLNGLWYRFPARNAVKARCRVKVCVGQFKNGTDKTVFQYKCENCNSLNEKIDIDHIIPKIDVQTGFINLDDFCSRFFCDVSNLQALCNVCHSAKNKEEAGIRAVFRKERKTEEKC